MPTRPLVLLDPHFRRMEEIFSPEDLQRLIGFAEVVWGQNEPAPASELEKAKAEAQAVVVADWNYGPLDEFKNLKAILEVGGRPPSPEKLDYKTCFARGIRVLSCAPAFGPMVAEMALGMALACTRDIVKGHDDFVLGDEQYIYDGNVGTFTLYDQPVGFIGFGGLAKALQPLLDPFRCKIRVYDPWLPETYLRNAGVEPMALEELLETSKVIFVLAIPSRENKALLDRPLLEKIQKDCVLALISRSHLVDFDALTELLHEGRFKAAIDVFPEEPLPRDHPIRSAPGVILSAHRAGSVEKDLRRIGKIVVDDLEALAAGLPPYSMQQVQPEWVFRLE